MTEIALEQLNDKLYHAELSSQGVKEILEYGIAFSGKNACVKAAVREF